MRIICAPDKFKGSLDAADAARLMRMGIMDAAPDAVVDLCPMADGGEGFAGTLAAAIGSALTWRSPQDVTGPMGDRVAASFYCVDQAHGDQSLAIVEMASASGLALAPAESRDPTRATTTVMTTASWTWTRSLPDLIRPIPIRTTTAFRIWLN